MFSSRPLHTKSVPVSRPRPTVTKLQRISTIWFSAGVVLTTATTFRSSGAPIGPGEVLLAGWACAHCLAFILTGRVCRPPIARALLWFWAISGLSLLVGTLSGIAIGVGPSVGFYHDIVAFLFVALVALVFASAPALQQRAATAALLIMSFTIVPLLGMLVTGHGFPGGTARFHGWAENPNQTALAVVMVPFYAIFQMRRSVRLIPRIYYAFLAFATVVIGIATGSDALTVAWALGLLLALLNSWYEAVRRPTRNLLRLAALRVLPPLLGLFLLVAIWHVLSGPVYETVIALYNYGGQGSVRVLLALQGIRAMRASPVFGLGPGGHSGYSAPFRGSEAHNTFVDWGASAGLVGVTLYLALVGWLVLRAWKRGDRVLAVGLISMLAFSSLHYVLRHPIFWFYLVAIAEGGREKEEARVHAGAHERSMAPLDPAFFDGSFLPSPG